VEWTSECLTWVHMHALYCSFISLPCGHISNIGKACSSNNWLVWYGYVHLSSILCMHLGIYLIFKFCQVEIPRWSKKFLPRPKLQIQISEPSQNSYATHFCVELCQNQVTLVRTLSLRFDQEHTHTLHKIKCQILILRFAHPYPSHHIHPSKKKYSMYILRTLHLQEEGIAMKWKK